MIRKILMMAVLILTLTVPVQALELTAPTVPAAGAERMPEDVDSFGEAVVAILMDALGRLRPDLREAAVSCTGVLAAVMALALLSAFPGHRKGVTELVGTLAVGGLLLRSADSLISLGVDTVAELSGYGRLLLPVMTAALSAQGGITSAAALYTGTAVFDAILSGLISKLLVPLLYFFLALAAAYSALGDPMLKTLRDQIRGISVWGLKTILYVYTGYISITGVVSGTTDAGVLKAAKLTISGVVPVVGSILSDASEAVLVSAAAVKNAAGIYGMAAILAVWIGPFVKIGVHYLILKGLTAVCGVFGVRSVTGLVGDFASVMGILLAMTGAVCLMLLISTVCFLKGVGV